MGEREPVVLEARQLLPQGEEVALALRLRQHECLCLIGPDSPRLCHYLRTLAGVEPSQQGELLLLGQTAAGLDKRGQQIGFVASTAPILSVLCGLDNVMLPALYHNRMTRPEARRRARELLEEIGYRGGLSKLPAFLSIQQRLQLAIARATILEPAVLFVELPFTNLSLAEQEPIFHYLRNCHRKRALVVATHNLRLVQTAATQILFLGEQRAWHFTCWQALTQHDDDELNHYLSLYRQQYQPT